MMAIRTGHLGPTVYRSTDWGESPLAGTEEIHVIAALSGG
jgi:hypothetical protein